jgi:hypothetical protein
MSNPRSQVIEGLARLIHDNFERRSLETKYAGEGEVTPWDHDDDGAIPDSYREALRLTCEDVFDSTWFREVIRTTAVLAIQDTAERWAKGDLPGALRRGWYGKGADSYVMAEDVKGWMLAVAELINKGD